MDADRWAEIRALFDDLVEAGASARAARLDRLRARNPGLCATVEALLAADANVDERLGALESTTHGSAAAPDPFRLRGQTVSHFRVIEPLGAGGMGVVYRGEDIRLRRAVALKFLLPQHQLDTAAKDRFLHEARSAGSLDHANLCTIYAAEEDDAGRLFVAMPLYAGETLKARLERLGPLPVEDAVAITRQVADGLACAHAASIVHRDVKPGNLMLLPDATVKVLDFGLAKMRDLTLTGSGTMLGTAAYMAPEQVCGEAVTELTDVWSLGVVLYELLTGRRPFAGEHEAAIAHAIVNDDPVPPSSIRAEITANLDTIALRALEKAPADRWQGAREFADALSDVRVAPGHPRLPRWMRGLGVRRTDAGRGPSRRLVRPLAVGVTTVTAASLAVGVWGWPPGSGGTARSVEAVAFELVPPPGTVLVQGATASLTVAGSPFAFAPDGRSFVFMAAPASGGSPRLYLRSLAELTSRPIADSENATFPTFSPDGRSIAFLSGNEVRRVSATGGASDRVAALDPTDVRGLAWASRGIVVGNERSGLALLPAAGGAATVVTHPDTSDAAGGHRWPIALPDGETVLFNTGGTRLRETRIGIVRLSSGRTTVLDLAGVPLAFIDGVLIFHDADHSLFGVPMEVGGAKTRGSPVLLAGDVTIGRAGAIKAALSANGSLIYFSGSGLTAPRELVSIAPTGEARSLVLNRHVQAVRQAPDGRRLALTIVVTGPGQETWFFDDQSGTLEPFHVRPGYRPEWSPDGRSLLLRKLDGIWRIPTNGPGTGELLVPGAEYAIYTPDGRGIVYRTQTNQLLIRSVEGDTTSRPVAAEKGTEYGNPAVSPDGRWIAYPSNGAGDWHIYVQPLAGPGPRHVVSSEGGDNVAWGRDSRRLHYSFGGRIIEATVTFTPAYRVSRRVVFTNVEDHSLYRPWDVAADGSLLTTRPSGPDAVSRVRVVSNWAAGLRPQVGAR